MKSLYFFLTTMFATICTNLVHAQDLTYSVYSGSDYYVYVDYDMDKVCNCTDSYSLAVYRSSARPANLLGSSNKKKAKISLKIGPSRTNSYVLSAVTKGKNKLLFVECGIACEAKAGGSRSTTTSRIRTPSSARATRNKDAIEITWSGSTDIPASQHYYRIARDQPNNVIANKVSGVNRNATQSFTDNEVGPDASHTYYIYTVTDSWSGHESTAAVVTGTTRPRTLYASKGKARTVDLSWDDLSQITNSITIRRNGAQIAELNINSSADTAYADSDPALIPGRNYTYSIAWARGESSYSLDAEGASQPNGRISGRVQTPRTQLPISGVEVCVVQETDLDQSPAGTTYCDTTDEFGDYEIRRIFYDTEATFSVSARKENHQFDPMQYDGQRLELEVPSKTLNFDDTTAFVVSGRIVQTLNRDTCGLAGVEIWVDGLFKGTITDAEGYFSMGIEESGTYMLEPRSGAHVFEPAAQSVLVNRDTTGIDFANDTKYAVEGVVKAACDLYIGAAQVRIYSGDGQLCLDTTVTTDSSGYYSALLPARQYQIEVTDFQPRADLNLDPDQVLSYYPTVMVDLRTSSQRQDFIFRRPPSIVVEGIPASSCPDLDGHLVEQNREYELRIIVSEVFGDEECRVDTGMVIVYDEVGDKDNDPDTLILLDGEAYYYLKPGAPNLVAPHQKTLQLVARVESETSDWSETFIVTGNRPREQTFATVMPEIPFMILHDPPGDGSYSFREQAELSEMALRLYGSAEASVEVRTEVKLGSSFEVSDITGIFATGVASWGTIGTSLAIGARLASDNELILTNETVERFSTSDNDQITGEEGDLYIGGAMNMIYALTDVLEVDPATCAVELSQSMIMGNDGFATTFMYTEDHIRETLLPQLQQIRAIYLEQHSDSAELYRNQIAVWQQVLDNNRRNKQNARTLENRSFSAGAAYTSTTTIQSQASSTLEISAFVDAGVAVGAGFEIAGSGVNGQVETRMRVELGSSITGTSLRATTTGFELRDDDQGDFFSVDIKEDPVYGTPVFDVLSGRSSCPNEPRTQAREEVQLQADIYHQFDVPTDEAAVFVLSMGNISQSDEPRTYLLRFLQESNPDGAIITVGGSQVQAPIPFTIPAGGERKATVTIGKGARSNNYNNLQFVLLSGCEDDQIADTVALSVAFQSDLPPIRIVKPNPVWKINQHDEGSMLVRFAVFDPDRLAKVQLQYAPADSYTWQNGAEWLPDQLQGYDGDYTDIWETGSIVDGAYDIRFRADYGTGEVFSDIHRGYIDREGPHLFGIPEPADRILGTGDVISISFDEPIDCQTITTADITMEEQDSGAIYPVQIGCSGQRLIISPLWNIQSHIGKNITVKVSGIRDLAGNLSRDSVYRWSFRVEDGGNLQDQDIDLDGITNPLDNCSLAYNPNQSDQDGDGIGDTCDDDLDGDGIINIMDNCMDIASEDQSDLDEDGIGDLCDEDMDGDGISNAQDNCPTSPNPLQGDEDGNNIGDVCEDVTSSHVASTPTLSILAFPNPASELVTISWAGGDPGSYHISLETLNGSIVRSLQHTVAIGTIKQEVQLEVGDLAAGLYLVRIESQMQHQVSKISIIH